MARRLKLLTGLSTIAVSGALALSGCGEGEGTASAGADGEAAPSAHHGEGESEGEGMPAPVAAGGESEGAALVDIAHDKAAFLSALQIVRGHLRAGTDLYDAGERDVGTSHLRHPQAEIMTTLAPAFAVYGAENFSAALDTLAASGEHGAPPAEIGAEYEKVLGEIAAAGAATNASVQDKLLAAAKTLTVAGDEYSVAVKDDAIVNLHEYHDAYGFIAVALSDLEALKGANAAENAAISAAIDQVKAAQAAAASPTPPASGFKPPSLIYGAAARIEIAARGI